MGTSADRDLALSAAAHFNVFIIEHCFTGRDDEISEILGSGLMLNGDAKNASSLLEDISTKTDDGATFRTRDMIALYPDECLELAETFASALLAGAGSQADDFLRMTIPEKSQNVSRALTDNAAPTLGRFFMPYLS